MRYDDCDKSVYDMLNNIVAEHFPDYDFMNFKLIFDNKKKKKGGSYVFATIKRVNELTEFLASENFHFVVLIDKQIWNAVDEEDKKRILRHELRHVFLDEEANDPYKLKDHSVNDFYEEIELNKNDPRWAERVAEIASSIYEKEDE